MLAFIQGVALAQPYGTGTVSDPYQIRTISDLLWFSGRTDLWRAEKYFIQMNDIDASPIANFTPVGNATTAAILHYDGQNFSISNLKVKREEPMAGLFGNLESGTLKNIKLYKAAISCTTSVSDNYVGTLVGYNGASIFNCHTYESTVVSNGDHVGGLVGTSTGTIEQCYVWTHSTGRSNIGGVAGSLIGGTIRSCYTNGKFTASEVAAGGICGLLSDGALISNCYTRVAETYAYNYAGGIAGKNGTGAAKVEYCYSAGDVEVKTKSSPKYIGAVSGDAGITQVKNLYDYLQSYNGNMGTGSTGKTTGAFWVTSTFIDEGWDFLCETANGSNDYWKLKVGDNGGFPRLTWDGAPFSENCKEWNGNLSSNWNTSGNWTPLGAPAPGDAIYIRGNADNNPILPGNVELSNVIFGSETGTTRLILGNYNLTVGKIMNARPENYVRTDGTGKVIKAIANGESFTFPIGISGYSPVTVTNNTGTADVFNARVINAVFENGESGAQMAISGVKRTWNIGKNSPNGGEGVTLTFNWNATDVVNSLIVPSVHHYNVMAAGGSKWEKYTNNLKRKDNTLTFSGYMDSFSPFIILENTSTLPVSWGAISIGKQQESALLKWTVLSEENVHLYFIQHSVDGFNWTTIGTVNTTGITAGSANYQYLHNNPSNGVNYYRIKQQDINGRQNISKTVVLEWSFKNEFRIYPNPSTTGVIQITATNPGVLSLYNSNGALIKQLQIIRGTNILDISSFAKGVYILKTSDESINLIVR